MWRAAVPMNRASLQRKRCRRGKKTSSPWCRSRRSVCLVSATDHHLVSTRRPSILRRARQETVLVRMSLPLDMGCEEEDQVFHRETRVIWDAKCSGFVMRNVAEPDKEDNQPRRRSRKCEVFHRDLAKSVSLTNWVCRVARCTPPCQRNHRQRKKRNVFLWYKISIERDTFLSNRFISSISYCTDKG